MKAMAWLAAVMVAGTAWGRPAPDPLTALRVPPGMVGEHLYGMYLGAQGVKVGELSLDVVLAGRSVHVTSVVRFASQLEQTSQCTYTRDLAVVSCELLDPMRTAPGRVVKRKGKGWVIEATGADGAITRTPVAGTLPLRAIDPPLLLVAALVVGELDAEPVGLLNPDAGSITPMGLTMREAVPGGGARLTVGSAVYQTDGDGTVVGMSDVGDQPLLVRLCDGPCPARLGGEIVSLPDDMRAALRALMAAGMGWGSAEALVAHVDWDGLLVAIEARRGPDDPQVDFDEVRAQFIASIAQDPQGGLPPGDIDALLDVAVQMFQVTFEGEVATVLAPNAERALVFRKVDGAWKLDIIDQVFSAAP